jgi:glycosyltransferase involved in cell wall biosynthesis
MAARSVSLVSFIIPAHNEEAHLGATVEAVAGAAAALGIEHEVIVVDDASTDRTAEVARMRGARVESVNLRQISRVRNAGARAARGDVLVFVDADTRVTPAVVRGAVEAIERGAAGGGAVVRMDGRPGPLAWCVLKAWNVAARLVRIAAGCFVFVRRGEFEAVGGFSEELFASEEVELSAALRRRAGRRRFVILRVPVVTSGRKLRTHTTMEILSPLCRYVLFGRRAMTRREGLELWYERRGTGV